VPPGSRGRDRWTATGKLRRHPPRVISPRLTAGDITPCLRACALSARRVSRPERLQVVMRTRSSPKPLERCRAGGRSPVRPGSMQIRMWSEPSSRRRCQTPEPRRASVLVVERSEPRAIACENRPRVASTLVLGRRVRVAESAAHSSRRTPVGSPRRRVRPAARDLSRRFAWGAAIEPQGVVVGAISAAGCRGDWFESLFVGSVGGDPVAQRAQPRRAASGHG